ncbi:MAG: hypothetical protein C4346_02280 [Chloroflexota bacterium]
MELEQLRPLDRSTDRNTDAEYALYRLPSRFLRYAEEYLLPDEHILAFVPWTATVADTWRTRLGRILTPGGRQPRQGILLVTERQVLLMRDDIDPVAGILFAGYAVEATTHERLIGVRTWDEPGGKIALAIELRAAATHETLTLTFPESAAPEIQQIASLLAGFLPRPDHRRLRLPGRIVPREAWVLPGSRSGSGLRPATNEEVDEATRSVLQAQLDKLLRAHPDPTGAPRHVHALAMIPDTGDGAHLMALTQEHLFVVPLPDRARPHVTALTTVTSVELRRSVLGTHVGWRAGGGEGARRLVTFPPVAAAQSLDVFAALRQALTLLQVEAEATDVAGGSTEAANHLDHQFTEMVMPEEGSS